MYFSNYFNGLHGQSIPHTLLLAGTLEYVNTNTDTLPPQDNTCRKSEVRVSDGLRWYNFQSNLPYNPLVVPELRHQHYRLTDRHDQSQ